MMTSTHTQRSTQLLLSLCPLLSSACPIDWSKEPADAGTEDVLDAQASEAGAATSERNTLDEGGAHEGRATADSSGACVNECGGPCEEAAGAKLGDQCTNGLPGACVREGAYVCAGSRLTCSAPVVLGGPELCGDEIDNDCDDAVDEEDAVDAKSWYRDCDGDGFASAEASNPTPACKEPPPGNGCAAWTEQAPNSPDKIDCDDTSAAHHPGADFAYPWSSREEAPESGSMEYDLDCDGELEDGPLHVMFDFGSNKVMLGACGEPVQNTSYCCYGARFTLAGGCGNSVSAEVECAPPGAGLTQGEVTAWFVCK